MLGEKGQHYALPIAGRMFVERYYDTHLNQLVDLRSFTSLRAAGELYAEH
jgi:hypothetical protein